MNKQGLDFRSPYLNAAGTLGFAPDARLPLNWAGLGAFVTNPISLRSRRPAAEPALVNYPGGFLLHTGLPNPGFEKVIRKYASRWARSELPIIVHLMSDRPEEAARMVRSLEGMENVAAVELGFAPLLSPDILLVAVEMCQGELPLIVNLPPDQLLPIGGKLMQAGAAAISMAPPRGALAANSGSLVTGRLFGPALFAQSMLAVREAARVQIPLIGGGGVYSKENARMMLDAGVLAVQIDCILWRGDFEL